MELAVQRLIQIGAQVVAVVCDSPRVQISMMLKLGVDMNPEQPNSQILRHLDSPPIYMVQDMCHIIKNVRNAWAHFWILRNRDGEKISWQYIEEIVNIQMREGLTCANKLTYRHINFKPQIMKVKYAVQVLSRSVSLTLKHCREDLKLRSFEGSEATEEFVMKMNDVFDIFNSKSFCDKGLKKPMTTSALTDCLSVFDSTRDYILGLTTDNGLPIVTSCRKTAFVGILTNIASIKSIFHDIVTAGPLNFLCTYKFSQDFLEHYFGLIRARFGANNNPTPHQFKAMYRKLVLGISNNIVHNSNVLLQDDSEILAIVPSPEDKIEYIYEVYDLDFDLEVLSITPLSEFKQSIVNYISGYVVKKLKCKLTCETCIIQMSVPKNNARANDLTNIRDFGNFLIYPSPFIKTLCSVCEKILSLELESTRNYLTKKYFFDFICLKIVSTFVSSHGNFFLNMDNHAYELSKKIVSCYVAIRLKHFAKIQNDALKRNRLRSKLSKLIIHSHQ